MKPLRKLSRVVILMVGNTHQGATMASTYNITTTQLINMVGRARLAKMTADQAYARLCEMHEYLIDEAFARGYDKVLEVHTTSLIDAAETATARCPICDEPLDHEGDCF